MNAIPQRDKATGDPAPIPPYNDYRAFFGLQLWRHFDGPVNNVDLHERTLRQWRIGYDDAVFDEARNDVWHDMTLRNHLRGL